MCTRRDSVVGESEVSFEPSGYGDHLGVGGKRGEDHRGELWRWVIPMKGAEKRVLL